MLVWNCPKIVRMVYCSWSVVNSVLVRGGNIHIDFFQEIYIYACVCAGRVKLHDDRLCSRFVRTTQLRTMDLLSTWEDYIYLTLFNSQKKRFYPTFFLNNKTSFHQKGLTLVSALTKNLKKKPFLCARTCPQTNTSLLCAFCPQSYAPKNQEDFSVGHSSQYCFGSNTLDIRYFRDRFSKNKMHIVGINVLSILLSLWPGYHPIH